MQLRLEKLDILNLNESDKLTLNLMFNDEKFRNYILNNRSNNFNEYIECDNIVYVTKNEDNDEIVTLFIMDFMLQEGEYDIVYGTNPLYRESGYTKKGFRLLQKRLLQEEIFETIFAVVVPENVASKKLLYSIDFYNASVSNNATLLRYDLRKSQNI